LALRVATLGLTAYLIGSSCGMVLGGFLADKTDQHHRVAMIGIAVVASLMLLIAAAPGIGAVAVPVLFAAGVAGGITSPSRDVLIRRAAAGAGAGTGSVFGFVYSGLDLGSALAPPIFGALIDYHAAQVAFLAIAAAYALAAPTVMQVQSRAAAGRHVPAIAG
jgi:FSR family fosmidomycin resistance protein-like MFS transporter